MQTFPLIVIIGPTAVGKTELSLQVCEQLQGEIVGADSRQIYRYMDIGTAKPTQADLARVPHHLIDICNPDEILTVSDYQQRAYTAIDEIRQRHHLPFLIGGTALYIRAVVAGLRIPAVPPNLALRHELETQLAQDGVEALFARLQKLDPATAAAIDGKNPRRVLRALEIFISTGRSKIDLEGAEPPPYPILLIGLDRPRQELYQRIDGRVEAMIAQGLVAETARLLQMGYAPTLPAMTSLGYREITAYLQGALTLEEAKTRIKLETHRFVRNQYTSFRKMANVTWLLLPDQTDLEQSKGTVDLLLERISDFVAIHAGK